jgi:hypothetical protein
MPDLALFYFTHTSEAMIPDHYILDIIHAVISGIILVVKEKGLFRIRRLIMFVIGEKFGVIGLML